MTTGLEILLPLRNPGAELTLTAASLAAQTDRQFSVLLGEDALRPSNYAADLTQRQLTAAGIAVRRVKPPFAMKRIEYFNWLHTQAQAAWLKPLLPGEQLKAAYVERLRQRMSEKPRAQFIRCDLALDTEWGTENLVAPFEQSEVKPAELPHFFPAEVEWLSRSANVAYSRTAWLAMGGYSPQLPASARLHFNVLLALHYGLENLGETLATADLGNGFSLNENGVSRVNHSLELWLILRQAKNYCAAAKLPWPGKCLFLPVLTAALRRW
jgi:hypothetical protein